MSNWLVDPATRALTGALNGLSAREAAIAANIANVDTPGYKAVSVGFEQELAAQMAGAASPQLAMNPPQTPPPASEALAQAAAGHLPGVPGESTLPSIYAASSGNAALQMRLDANGVDVDTQMTTLAETQLKYAATSRMLTGKLQMLKDVVAR